MTITRATPEDVPFLVKAMIAAERAHTGKGYWDFFLPLDMANRDQLIVDILSLMCANDEDVFFHYSRFFVLRDENGTPVSSIVGFVFPEFNLSGMKGDLFRRSLEVVNANVEEDSDKKISVKQLDECWERIGGIVFDGFPASPEVNDQYCSHTWILETVYTEPEHRGKGFSSMLIQHALAEGERVAQKIKEEKQTPTCDKTLICCAVGNDKAMNVYKRAGFRYLDKGYSATCLEYLGTEGFSVLRRDF